MNRASQDSSVVVGLAELAARRDGGPVVRFLLLAFDWLAGAFIEERIMSNIVTPEPRDWPGIIKRHWELSRELEASVKGSPLGDALFPVRGRGHELLCPAASHLRWLLAAHDLADSEEIGTACKVTLSVGESYRAHLRNLGIGAEPDLAPVLGVLEDRLRAVGWSPRVRLRRDAPAVVFRRAVAAIADTQCGTERRAEVASSQPLTELAHQGQDAESSDVTTGKRPKPRRSQSTTCEDIMLWMLREAHAGEGGAGIEEMSTWDSSVWFAKVNERAAKPYADAKSVRKTGLWRKILKPLGAARKNPAASAESVVSRLDCALRLWIEDRLPDADTALIAADRRKAEIDKAVTASMGEEREQELRRRAARNRAGEGRVPPQEFEAAAR